jgi:hypothetical protein
VGHTDLTDVSVRFLGSGRVFTATPHLRVGMELSVDLKADGGEIRSRHGLYSTREYLFFIGGFCITLSSLFI